MSNKINQYDVATKPYIPIATNILFIAESPPDSHERYFYFPNVRQQDSLWIELMKALYEENFGEVRNERIRKKLWLSRFKNDGYRLIDAVKEPFPQGLSNPKKQKIISECVPDVIKEVKEISPNQIVLIKAPVYEILYPELSSWNFPVVNGDVMLPFPGSGQQTNFQEGFRKLIANQRLVLTTRKSSDSSSKLN